MSDWIFGRLIQGKRIKCNVCGRTHQWDRRMTDEDDESITENFVADFRFFLTDYGIRDRVHFNEDYIVGRDYSSWLIKVRKNLVHKSHRSNSLYTEYVALCPEHRRQWFDNDKKDALRTQPIGEMEFNPFFLAPNVNEPEPTGDNSWEDAGITAYGEFRVGDFVRRNWEHREGHITNGQIGRIESFINSMGVALVRFPFLGVRHCQLNRYDKINSKVLDERFLSKGIKVYAPIGTGTGINNIDVNMDTCPCFEEARAVNQKFFYVVDYDIFEETVQLFHKPEEDMSNGYGAFTVPYELLFLWNEPEETERFPVGTKVIPKRKTRTNSSFDMDEQGFLYVVDIRREHSYDRYYALSSSEHSSHGNHFHAQDLVLYEEEVLEEVAITEDGSRKLKEQRGIWTHHNLKLLFD